MNNIAFMDQIDGNRKPHSEASAGHKTQKKDRRHRMHCNFHSHTPLIGVTNFMDILQVIDISKEIIMQV